jgi:hypothetical protein
MTHPFLERLLERWTEEFSRAVETQTSQRPEVAHARVEQPEQWAQKAAGLLWWKQAAESGEDFGVWIGAEEPCWSGLGSASEEGGDPKQAYFELLRQANQSLATAAGAEFATPLRWREGSEEQAPPALETLELLEVRIRVGGKALPPFLVGVDRAAQILEASSGLPRFRSATC